MKLLQGGRPEDTPPSAEREGASAALPLPEDALILLPVRDIVLFPTMIVPITVGRPKSIAAIQEAVREERPIGVVLQRDPAEDDPSPDGLHRIGTTANILRYMTAPDGTHTIVCQGTHRFRILDFLQGTPFPVARVLEAGDSRDHRPHRAHGQGDAHAGPPHRGAAAVARDRPPDQGVARRAPARNAAARADGRDPAPARRGRGGQVGRDGRALGEAITKAKMPKEVEDQARKELRRLERMPEAAAEYGMIRTYLDWLIELPWALPEEETPIDIGGAAHPRRGPLRARQDQAPHRRVPGGAQAGAAGQGADPVLRRPAGRRQDLARPVDRARHGPQVRARQPRRRA
jgi:ATP-dependent Lon protease